MAEEPGKQQKGNEPAGLTEAAGAIVTIAREAFQGLPPNHRIVVALAAFLAIVMMSVGVLLGVAGALPAWAIIVLFCVAVLFFVFALGFLFASDRLAARAKEPSKSLNCRRVPTYPLADEALSKLHDALEVIQTQAHVAISRKSPAVESKAVRANIFLLAKTEQGEYKLVIHPRLHVNMEYAPEWNIQLSPGQGATGIAFQRNNARLTRRLPTQQGEWDASFEMTDELKSIIHPDLKWILTLPLTPPGQFQPLGILNIDGLVDITDDNLLLGVASEIREPMEVIASYLDLQPSICIDVDLLE